jgi:hypothetical protein
VRRIHEGRGSTFRPLWLLAKERRIEVLEEEAFDEGAAAPNTYLVEDMREVVLDDSLPA